MKPEIDEVYTFKLITGEELVAKIIEIKDDYFVIKEPISCILSPQGLQMMPTLFSANKDKNVRLNNSSCAMIADVREDVRSSYIQATTGIAPVSKQIITG